MKQTHARTLFLMVATAALLAAGCGSGSDDGSKSDASSKTKTEPSGGGEAAAGEQATADLKIHLEKIGSKDGTGLPVPSGIACTKSIPATCNATVSCPVDADADPSGAEVCAWLAGDGADALLVEPPDGEVCTMQYGGPELATVTGTLDGEDVDASFSRQDGCAIARYDAVAPRWTRVFETGGETDGDGATTEPTTSPDAPVSSGPSDPEVIDDPPEAFR